MKAERFEAFLAKLYVDDKARARFLADPRAEANRAGLTAEQCNALESIDTVGIQLAADSFAHKRAAQRPQQRTLRILRWLSRT
jgi:hypothetical protein